MYALILAIFAASGAAAVGVAKASGAKRPILYAPLGVGAFIVLFNMRQKQKRREFNSPEAEAARKAKWAAQAAYIKEHNIQ